MRTIVLLCVHGYAHAAHRQLYHISPSPSPPPATPPFDALSQCTAVIDLGCYGTAEYQCRSSILALLEFIGGTPSSARGGGRESSQSSGDGQSTELALATLAAIAHSY